MIEKQKRKRQDAPLEENHDASCECDICKGDINGIFPVVQCKTCNKWCHTKCVGLAEGIPTMITHDFKCPSCCDEPEIISEWQSVSSWRSDPARLQPPSTWLSVINIPLEWVSMVVIGRFTFKTNQAMNEITVSEHGGAIVSSVHITANRISIGISEGPVKIVESSVVPPEHQPRLSDLRALCLACSVPCSGFNSSVTRPSPADILKELLSDIDTSSTSDYLIKRRYSGGMN
eukprot:TRINITY_DN10151_c3_g1_i2.p1 TRINITY_DN10151_c3_g1~~TRINITY_DN10151_c3_g1_i2.p1  ORF type:complete len:232 (+),score=29.34 TRINITY_DN10151_c3_g1_i2:137-832(+)